jgi:hypothetical protein
MASSFAMHAKVRKLELVQSLFVATPIPTLIRYG